MEQNIRKRPKKVILIIADTLRAKNVGIYGIKPSPTPNLDFFAKSGAVFTNCYASITCTDPAVTSLMSGKFPLNIGLVNQARNIKEEEEENVKKNIFLAQILKENNFLTYALDWLGRWHKIGFDIYSSKIRKESGGYYPIVEKLPFPLLFRIIDKIAVKYTSRELILRLYYALLPKPYIPYDPADVVIDETIKILKKHQRKEMFLYIHLWDTHAPHTHSRGVKSYLLDNVDATYNHEVRFLDEQLGRLFKFLEESGQLNESLIIFTADHGENLYGHDIPFNHENLYDDVVKIPLIIRHPNIPSRKMDSLVQHVDVFATILDFLNIKVPKQSDGKSLLPVIYGKAKKIRDFICFDDITYRKLSIPKQTRRRGIRAGKFKYIQTLFGRKEDLTSIYPREDLRMAKEEFFDLKKDPQEKNNLISKKPKLAGKLREKLWEATQELNLKRLDNYPELKSKVEQAIKIIKKAQLMFKSNEVAIAFKGGKDTTTMMHILRIVNKGKIPFKVFFNDTTMEFEETYQFIEKMRKLWDLDLVVIRHNVKELEQFDQMEGLERKKELANQMKITAIRQALKKYKFKGFMLGIRRNENPARANEKYFSKREDHIRIHPLLDWTEEDIWQYIKHFGVPYNELYDKGYRSVGEKPFTKKSAEGEDERSGRDQEKEKVMTRLRRMGYW